MILNGTPGADNLVGSATADTIFGVGGNDLLVGGGGADSLDGGDGDDRIFSAAESPPFNLPYAGNPYVFPLLDTGTEVDTIQGGPGSDRIFAGYGDNVDGGDPGVYGNYLYISFQGAPTGVTADFGLATQTIGGGVITNMQNISYVEGSQFNDSINAQSYASNGYSEFTTVRGMGGNDTLSAGYYTGALFGDDGDDVLDGRPSQYLFRVDGGAGNDTLYTNSNTTAVADGGPGNDLIYAHGTTHGGAGNDTIVMQQTYYSGPVFGDDGDDQITAAANGNVIAGGAGADILNGGGGADSLYSADYAGSSNDPAPDMGLEHDVLSGGGGGDTLAIGYGDDADGGAGTDTLYLSLGGLGHGVQFDAAGIVGAGPFSLGGGVIQNMESLLYLRGTDYADTLTLLTQTGQATVDAGAGDDVIIARSSSIWVLGGAGDDRFISGAAADHFDGGAGYDTVDFTGSSVGVTVNLTAGTGGDGDTYVNVEAVLGSSFADTLTAGGGSVLHGGAGADSLAGAANASAYGDDGDDQLSGGSGGGFLFGGAGNDRLTGGGLAASSLYGDDGNDTLSAGVSGDRLVGGVGADHLSAGAFSAILEGGQGDDVLDGGSGAATASYEAASGRVSVDLRIAGPQAVGADQGTDTLINIENVLGGAFNDSLHGDAHANTLQGGGGDDTLMGGAGDDRLDGGLGLNTVSYAEATGAVTVSLAAPGPQNIGGGEGVDTLSHFQNLTGGAFGDMLYGDAQANVLVGGGGDDTLQGGDGNDTLDGGSGADLFVATESGGADWVIGWEQGDSLHTSSVAATASNYVESTAADDASALALATARIQAGAVYVAVAVGANVEVYSDSLGLHTGSSLGEVVLQGRTLADISVANVVGGAAPQPPPTPPPPTPGPPPPQPVINGSTGLFIGNMEALHLGSLIGDAITTATSTALTLQGPGGNLTLFGTGFTYDGNEQITGGSVTSILYTAPGWNLNLQVPHVSAASFGGWVASDATAVAFQNIFALNDKLGGSIGADVIHGYGGDDVLYGEGGGDSLYGGDGNDQIFADYPLDMSGALGGGRSYLRGENGDDSILGGSGFDDINGNKGNDTVDGGSGGGDWLVGGQGDDLIIAHASQNILYGNLGNDTLNAGSGGDLMRGGQGNDILSGGAGNDWLSGDRGDDTISGGAGADTFHSFSGAGLDRVLDFHIGEGDRVQLDAGTTYTLSQVGSDTVINMGGGDQMILVGVDKATLTPGWIFTV